MSSYLVCDLFVVDDKKEIKFHSNFVYNQIRDDEDNLDEMNNVDMAKFLYEQIKNKTEYTYNYYDINSILKRVNSLTKEMNEIENKKPDYSIVSKIDFSTMDIDKAIELLQAAREEITNSYNEEMSFLEEIKYTFNAYEKLYLGMSFVAQMFDLEDENVYLVCHIE